MSGGHHFARHEGINQVQVAGKLGLSSATLHLALRIVDLFMDGHDIQVGTTQNWCEITPHVLPALRSHSYTWCVLGRCCWQARWKRGNNSFISQSRCQRLVSNENLHQPKLTINFRDGTMPRCSQLNLFVKNYFPLADFVNLEFVMLAYFNWNLVR